jgi:hypothetical protein
VNGVIERIVIAESNARLQAAFHMKFTVEEISKQKSIYALAIRPGLQ